MNDTEKIKEIEKIFDMFHNPEKYDYVGELDTIDVCMKIEEVLEK